MTDTFLMDSNDEFTVEKTNSEGLYSYYQATSLGEAILEHGVRELMREEWDLLDAYSD